MEQQPHQAWWLIWCAISRGTFHHHWSFMRKSLYLYRWTTQRISDPLMSINNQLFKRVDWLMMQWLSIIRCVSWRVMWGTIALLLFCQTNLSRKTKLIMANLKRLSARRGPSLQWRQNGRAGNSPVNVEFPAQRTRNAENVSIWWRHHGIQFISWVMFCCDLPCFGYALSGIMPGIYPCIFRAINLIVWRWNFAIGNNISKMFWSQFAYV